MAMSYGNVKWSLTGSRSGQLTISGVTVPATTRARGARPERRQVFPFLTVRALDPPRDHSAEPRPDVAPNLR